MLALGVSVLIPSSLLCLAHATQAANKPNFLILFADDMGYGDMSINGNPSVHTPHLDTLAAEGMRFTQWYSGFHICSPSRASMLTGRLPIRSGTGGRDWTGGVFMSTAQGGLPENETTFAQVLRDQGYATLAVGKWHLGQQKKFLPTHRGFDEYLGIPYSVDMGNGAWAEGYSSNNVPLPLLHNDTIIEQPTNLNHLEERYTNKTVSFIHEQVRANRPFLVYLAWSHVHVPLFAAPKFCNTSKRGRFGDAMQEMDMHIGRVMAGLKEAGVDNSTLVFFTSDNGPWLIQHLNAGSQGPFFEGKTTTWEGGVRVPAIVRWPGKIPAFTLSQEVAATYDIFATVVALAGGNLPQDRVIDGKDLSGVLFRGETSPHRCIFHYKGTPSTGLPPQKDDPQPGLWALRCGAYKAHFVTSCAVMQDFSDARCVGQDPNSMAAKSLAQCLSRSSKGLPVKCEELVRQANGPKVHNPPLLYNVEHDLGEMYPIQPSSDEYRTAIAEILDAKAAHEKTLTPVPNQMLLMDEPKLAVCCDNASKQIYPAFPACTCNPENFNPPEGVCRPVYPPTAHLLDTSTHKHRELVI